MNSFKHTIQVCLSPYPKHNVLGRDVMQIPLQVSGFGKRNLKFRLLLTVLLVHLISTFSFGQFQNSKPHFFSEKDFASLYKPESAALEFLKSIAPNNQFFDQPKQFSSSAIDNENGFYFTNCVNGVSISPSATQTLCQGATPSDLVTTITTVAGSGPAAITYEWFSNTSNSTIGGTSLSGGPQNSNTGQLTYSFTPATNTSGTLWYYCVITNTDAACTASTFTTIPVEITVIAPPTSATIGSNQNVCGTSATLSANNPLVGTGVWTVVSGSGTFSNANDPNATVSGLGIGPNVFRWTISNNPCTPSSAEVTITRNATTNIGVSISTSITSICEGSSVTFTATPTPLGVLAPVYQWRVNGVNVGSGAATFTTTTLNNLDKVSVVMTTSEPCPLPTASVTSNEITMTVNPVIYPSVSILSTASNICPGTPVTFEATPSNGGSSPLYQWQIDGVNVGGNSYTFNHSSFTDGQVVRVLLTSNATCASTSPATSNSIAITVKPAIPSTPGSISGLTPLCPGTSQTYSIAAVPNATSYNWSVPSGWTVSSNTGTSITVTSGAYGQDGDISVSATNSCGSSGLSTLPVVVSPGTPAIPVISGGTTSICPGSSQTFSIAAVPNASSYNWSVPTGWTINADNGTSITVTAGSAGQNGSISVTAINTCGNSTATKAVTVSPAIPTTPGLISGLTPVCPGTSQTYSISAVTNASDYTWAVPSGWTITSGQGTTSIVATAGSAGQGGNITVIANNSCGSSSASSTTVVVSLGTPATPVISGGTSTICPGSSQTFTIAVVPNASSYNWSVPTGWTINADNGTSITVTAGSAGQNGSISVTAINTCGNSTATKAVIVSPAIPSTPGSINGLTTVCPGTSNTYSILPVPNASIYNWTVPTGWTVTANTDTSITVTAGSYGQDGNIIVTATNNCGTSGASSLAVVVSPGTPATPVISGGTSTICPDSSQTFSIAEVPNATSYNWTVPTGWSITAGAGTNSITVTSGSAGQNGNITVTATNSCGTSSASSKAVTVSPGTPATPGAITGPAEVCISRTGIVFSIAAVANATTYTWSLPSGFTITSGNPNSNSITVSTNGSAVSGTVSVTAGNNCGTSAAQTTTVVAQTAVPAAPASITGATSVCPVAMNLPYTVPAIANATSYNWSLPTGFSILSGAGTNSIFMNIGASANTGSNTVSVSATNACGTGSAASTIVTVGTFAYANAGPDVTVCASSPNVTMSGSIGGATGNNDWDWSIVSGGGSFSNIKKLDAVFTPNAASITAGSVTIAITTKDPAGPSCTAVQDQMVITIKPNPTASISGTTPICSGTSTNVTFTATPNTTVTYNVNGGSNQTINVGAGGTATLNTGNLSAPATYALVNVAYTSSPSCINTVAGTFAVGINPPATVSAGTNQTICSGSSATLNGSIGGQAASATWTTSGDGTFSSTTSMTPVYTPGTNDRSLGTVTLTLTTNDPVGPCNAAISSMILTINPIATVAAGGNQTICAGSTATMAGSFGGAATSGTWSTSGSGTFNNAALTGAVYTPSASDRTAGTVTLTFTTNDPAGPCNAVSASMVLTINSVATVSAGINQTICAGTTATMAGNFGGAATSATWTTSGTGTFSNNNPDAVYTPSAADISAGSVVLTYTTDDPIGPCGTVTSTMVLTINPIATVVAGNNQTICAGSTATMAGSFGGAATSGTWSTSGSGTFNNASLPGAVYTPSASDRSAGTVTLTFTTNDPAGPCNAVSASMVLTIDPVATVSAGINQTICAGTTATMAGNFGGAATSATWTTSGTGTFSNNNPDAVYTPSAADISAGSVVLTYTTDDPNGPCGASLSTMLLTINPVATVVAGNNQTICAGSTATMAGDYGGAPNALWSTSGDGTFSSAGSKTAVYTPGTNDKNVGTVTLTFTTGDPAGPCGPVSASMVLTINPIATVSAGSNQTICSNSNATLAGAFGGGATSATWTTTGSGTFSSNDPNAIYTPGGADILAGSVVLTYTTDDPNGPCGAASASMTLTIKRAVSISTQPVNTAICATYSTSLSVVATGDALTYQWYKGTSPTGVALANTANISGVNSATLTFNQASLANDGIYYVVVSGAAPCNDATSMAVTLHVDQQIAISAQPVGITVCENAPSTFSVTAAANIGDILSYQWRKNGVNIPGANNSTYSIANTSLADAGNYDVVITGPAGYSCSSAVSALATLQVTPTVGTPSAISISAGSDPACQLINGTTTTSYTTNATNATSYTWSLSNPAAGTINPSTGVITWANGFNGSVNIQVVANGCNGPSAMVTRAVTVTPTVGTPSAISIVAGSDPACQLTNGTTTTSYSTNASNATSYTWSLSNPAAGTIDPSTGVITWASGFSGSVNIQVVANGCNGPSAMVTRAVTVTPTVGTPSAISIAAGSDPTCQLTNGTTSTSYSTSASNATGFTWSLSNPAAGTINPSTGVITWASGFSGSVNIQVVANGCNGPSAMVTRTVTVTPTVGMPSAISIAAGSDPTCQLTNGTTSTSYITSASNATGFTWSLSNPAAGTIDPSTGVITWASGFSGNVNIQVVANGCNGPSAMVTRAVTVTPTVGTPNAISALTAEPGCQLISGSVTTSYGTGAVNATGYTWSLSNPAAGTISAAGLLTWANGYSGTVNIQVVANGCNGPSAMVTRSVTVGPTVGTPIFTLGSTSTRCQGGNVVTYAATASNNTGLTYSLDAASLAGGNTINAATGAVTYAAGWSGTSVISVSAAGCNGPTTASHTVTITPTVGTPVFSLGNTSDRCQSAGSITYTASASNTTGITYGLDAASLAAGNTINAATGSVTYAAGWIGTTVITASAAGCNGPKTATHSVNVVSLPVGGTANNMSGVIFSCAGNNSGNISLTGNVGLVNRWESSSDGGLNWNPIISTATSIPFNNLTSSTWYRARVYQSICPTIYTHSAPALVSVVPHTGAGALVAWANPEFICSGSATLNAQGMGSDSLVGDIRGGEFDNAGVALDQAPGRWRAWSPSEGGYYNMPSSANNTRDVPFRLTNGPKEFFGPPSDPVTAYTVSYNNNPLGGQTNNNKFMVVAGPNTSTLETPIFNLVGLSTASIDWWQSYVLYAGASITIELSTDGGNTYTNTLRTITGPATFANPTNFGTTSIDLSAYAGLSNLRVRFKYEGSTYSSWGMEMATVTKGTVPATYTWSLYQPTPAVGSPSAHYLNVFQNPSVSVTPPSPNLTGAPITYSYSLQSSSGGCVDSINVTVNPIPTAAATPPPAVCTPAAINMPITGSIPGTTFTWSRAANPNVTGTVNSCTNNCSTINETLTNLTNTPQTVTYTIIPTYTHGGVGCPGAPVNVNVIVNPLPAATITGTWNCNLNTTTIAVTLSGTGPFSATLQPGNIAVNQANPGTYNYNVPMSATTTYTLNGLTGVGGCSPLATTPTPSVTVAAAGAGPAGLWVGTVDSDWFNKCNWANLTVPDNTVNVTIPNTAIRYCEIDPATSPYASLYGNVARSKDITISNQELRFQSTGVLNTAGNLTINGSTGYVNMINGGKIELAGNWTNNRGTAGFAEGAGTVEEIGTAVQTIYTVDAVETFNNLIIHNTSNQDNGVTLNSPVNVAGVFTLIDGRVLTSSTNLLTITNPALTAVVGGANNTYVNGPMARETNSTGAYWYPVGKPNGPYEPFRPAWTQPSSSGANNFKVEYNVNTTTAPPDLSNRFMTGILNTEHWQVDRQSGTANATMGLYYINPNNASHWSDVGPCSQCNVAIGKSYDISPSSKPWYFTNYPNFSSGFNSGTPEYRHWTNGGLIWSKPVSTFGPFTFAYEYNVILPVKLLYFNGKLNGDVADLTWKIEDSRDLQEFEVEYSTDGNRFVHLANIKGSTQTDYAMKHTNLNHGPNYYRLVMVEKTGVKIYSQVVLINYGGRPITVIEGLKRNPVSREALVSIKSATEQTAWWRVVDLQGKSLRSGVIKLAAGQNLSTLLTEGIANGLYHLQISTADGVRSVLKMLKE